jgi:hypothetical protein
MITVARWLVAFALAICMALPVLGGEGGENGGGTGIWILPRANFLTMNAGSVAPRDARPFSIQQDVLLQVSSEMGSCSATFMDQVSGSPVALQVTGSVVRMPAALLQLLGSMPNKTAYVTIADATQLGYLVRITVDAVTGIAVVQVF